MVDETKTDQESHRTTEAQEVSSFPEQRKLPPTPTNGPASELCRQGPQGDFHEMQLTPELLEWAQQLSTDQEVLADLQAVREQGGQELQDFLDELEQLVPRQ